MANKNTEGPKSVVTSLSKTSIPDLLTKEVPLLDPGGPPGLTPETKIQTVRVAPLLVHSINVYVPSVAHLVMKLKYLTEKVICVQKATLKHVGDTFTQT